MASTIIGKFPITQSVNSYSDEYGIQFVDYNFTIESKDAAKYIPKQGDAFDGIGGVANQNVITSGNRSKYLVTRVSADNLSGGLMRVQVNTAGTQNTQSPPIISTLPNYPLIFGLKTTANQYTPAFGYGSSNSGIGIMLSFIDSIENETNIFANFIYLPSIFRGVSVPVPASPPFYKSASAEKLPGENAGSTGFDIVYHGFIRKEITFQRIGGVSLFKLIFAESGTYYIVDCPPFAPGQNSVSCKTTYVYRF